MQEENIKFIALGCRLNTLEAEKIKAMLANAGVSGAIIVNTCAVTAEAERQSRQTIRKLARENPGAPLFITGCAATRAPTDYEKIKGVSAVVANKDKMNLDAYKFSDCSFQSQDNEKRLESEPCNLKTLSKAFVQIQNGCNHSCAYCIVSKLRGKNVSFPYEKILADVRAATKAGFYEVVLTGVDIAGFISTTPAAGRSSAQVYISESSAATPSPAKGNLDRVTRCKVPFASEGDFRPSRLGADSPSLAKGCPQRGRGSGAREAGRVVEQSDETAVKNFFLSDLCEQLLKDVPDLKRLRLSSMDPASPECAKVIKLMARQPRMLAHLHLSMQSGSDAILSAMGRRHNADMVRKLTGSSSPLALCGKVAERCSPPALYGKVVERCSPPVEGCPQRGRGGSCNIQAHSVSQDERTLPEPPRRLRRHPYTGGEHRPVVVPQNAGAEHHPATSFSWDIICGFPGETPELFAETCALIKELKPIHIHAFPFSPRPGTLAATMPNQVARAESKRRVRIVNELARENRRQFMRNFIGSTAQVLMEENNFGRTEDDIPVRVAGAPIPERTIIDVVIEDIENDLFIGLPL